MKTLNKNIGFRLNLQNKSQKEILELLSTYTKTFGNYCEFKLAESFLLKDIVKTLKFVEKNFKELNFSLHLPKNFLSYDLSIIIEYLNSIRTISDTTFFITHFNHEEFDLSVNEHFQRLEQISKYIPSNCLLLLENPQVKYSFDDYIVFLKELSEKLAISSTTNIKFCLDIGHIFYSFQKTYSQKEILTAITENYLYFEFIKEIHIHDFDNFNDHIALGKGILDFNSLIPFLKSNSNINNFVIETTVKNPISDGINQFLFLNNL